MSDDHLTLSTTLQRRGIDTVAQAAGWKPLSPHGRPGYSYPVHFDGGTAQRWKALDGKKPKYTWLPSKPAGCKYYLPQGTDTLRAAVAAAGGTLYIANGEPALLAYLAAGVQNVICWFGEGQPPHSLAADLCQWGVQTVRYPVDKDAAGEKSALKVRSTLKDSSIAFYPLEWGDIVPHKGDANDAWIAAGFDARRFLDELRHLGALILPTEAPEHQKLDYRDRNTFGTLKREDTIAEVIRRAETRPGAQGRTKVHGDWLNFCCLLHEEHEPSAGINTKTGAYTCFVCGSISLREVCEQLGIDYTPFQPQPPTGGAARPAPAAKPASQPVQVERVEPRFELKTVSQYGLLMCCSRVTALIALHMQAAGIADNFTVADLAQSAGISNGTAQRWLDEARRWGITERFSESTTIDQKQDSIVVKNEKRRGAAVARRYSLDLEESWSAMTSRWNARLRDHVQELLEYPEPHVIPRDEAVAAGAAEDEAENLELVTEEVAQSRDAAEVSARVERAADRKAKELLHRAAVDTTPFNPDALPASVSDLSAALIEAFILTDPDREWRHAELMWVAGVKRSSVRRLIAKTSLTPAEFPTFIDVPIEGEDLHRAVRNCSKEHHGAPVAWVDGKGEVICGMSREVPKEAKAVRLNIGKRYLRRAQEVEEKLKLPPSLQTAIEQPTSPPAEVDPVVRARRKARTGQLVALRGCMEARGWKYVPGPYSYWQRAHETAGNTWEEIVEALLLDVEWAREQQFIRRMQAVEF